jgi:hypothetical protein
MIGPKFFATATSNGPAVLTADELAGVNGGLLTGGEVHVPPAPPSGGSSGAQGLGSQWNWGGGQTNGRRTN